MPKTDLYLLIHQAQRWHLYRLGERIGRADPADADEMAAVAATVMDLIDRLEDHAHSEETYLHPLLRRHGWDPGEVEREHRELHVDLEALKRIVAQRRWGELYAAFNAFVATYLEHTASEERAQEAVLWARAEEEELRATLKRFKTERPPERARTDLGFMLPALSVPQAVALLAGIREGAPRAYAGACATAERELGAERWERIRRALAGDAARPE
jgi:hypothetical protein